MVRRKISPMKGGPGVSSRNPGGPTVPHRQPHSSSESLVSGVEPPQPNTVKSSFRYPRRATQTHGQPHTSTKSPESGVEPPKRSHALAGRKSASRVRRKKTMPGMKALREIKKLQRTTHKLIPKAAFLRLVKEILLSFSRSTGIERIQQRAVDALHESAEMVMVQLFEDSILCTIHAKRVTLQKHDIQLVRRLMGPIFFGMS